MDTRSDMTPSGRPQSPTKRRIESMIKIPKMTVRGMFKLIHSLRDGLSLQHSKQDVSQHLSNSELTRTQSSLESSWILPLPQTLDTNEEWFSSLPMEAEGLGLPTTNTSTATESIAPKVVPFIGYRYEEFCAERFLNLYRRTTRDESSRNTGQEHFTSDASEPTEEESQLLSDQSFALLEDGFSELSSTNFTAESSIFSMRDLPSSESFANEVLSAIAERLSEFDSSHEVQESATQNEENLYINPALITQHPFLNSQDNVVYSSACSTNCASLCPETAKIGGESLSGRVSSRNIELNLGGVQTNAIDTNAVSVPMREIDNGGQPVYNCSSCDFSANNLKKCNRHIKRTHHKSYRCDVCESQGRLEAFGLPSDLRRHMKQCHKVERPYQCSAEQCVQSFPRKDNLIRHVRNVHKREKTSNQG